MKVLFARKGPKERCIVEKGYVLNSIDSIQELSCPFSSVPSKTGGIHTCRVSMTFFMCNKKKILLSLDAQSSSELL